MDNRQDQRKQREMNLLKNTTFHFFMFAVFIIVSNLLIHKCSDTEPQTVSDVSKHRSERDSLLNLVYESEKQIIILTNQVKYLENEIRKDSAIIYGASPKQLIDLTTEFMRRIRQRDSLQ